MLANVQQKTIQPLIEAAVAKGARIHTDEVRHLRPSAGLVLSARDRLSRPWRIRV